MKLTTYEEEVLLNTWLGWKRGEGYSAHPKMPRCRGPLRTDTWEAAGAFIEKLKENAMTECHHWFRNEEYGFSCIAPGQFPSFKAFYGKTLPLAIRAFVLQYIETTAASIPEVPATAFNECPAGHVSYSKSFSECPSCVVVRERDKAGK